MTNEERAKKYKADIKKALKSFGEYSYYDKGASDVMSMGPVLTELKALSVPDVAETLRLVKDKNKHADPFLKAVVLDLQDWPGFDELLDQHKWLAEFY